MNNDEYIKIKKSVLIEVLWGICLAEHFGDVWESITPLIKSIGVSKKIYGNSLLNKMKEMDLVPRE